MIPTVNDPHRVFVSIILSKEFTIDITKDGEINETDVRLEKFLPDDILQAVANQENSGNSLNLMKEDAAGWKVDNVTVIET